MISIKNFFCLFLFFFSFPVYSLSLNDQLSDFFAKKYSIKKNNIHVIIHNKFKKNICCTTPSFLPLNNSNIFGSMNILFTCGPVKQYLQIELQVIGEYITAKRFIPRGTSISEKDIKVLIGRLDYLPNGTYLVKKEVINTINIRDIFPFQPITSVMTHPAWLMRMNQLVTVVINGSSFQVSTIGKVLNDVYENQIVYVKLDSNKIVSGIAKKTGEVVINM